MVSCDGEEKEEDIDPRDKFVGSWNVHEQASNDPTPINYSTNIDYSTNSAYIKIYNIFFQGSDQSVEALVTGDNLTISPQEVCDFEISGKGKYVGGDKFTLDYKAKDLADEITISATYTK